MASRIVRRNIVKDHDNHSRSEKIIIESGDSIAPDETTPQAEAYIKAFGSSAEIPQMLESMSDMFADLSKMLGSGGSFPFFTSKEVKAKPTSKSKTEKK